MSDLQVAHYVGTYFKYDSRIWICCAYDPRVDYFVAAIDGEPCMKDISVRAIGRTFHEIWNRENFSHPDLLVSAVKNAEFKAKNQPEETMDLSLLSEEDQKIIDDVYQGAYLFWKKKEEYWRKIEQERKEREKYEARQEKIKKEMERREKLPPHIRGFSP